MCPAFLSILSKLILVPPIQCVQGCPLDLLPVFALNITPDLIALILTQLLTECIVLREYHHGFVRHLGANTRLRYHEGHFTMSDVHAVYMKRSFSARLEPRHVTRASEWSVDLYACTAVICTTETGTLRLCEGRQRQMWDRYSHKVSVLFLKKFPTLQNFQTF